MKNTGKSQRMPHNFNSANMGNQAASSHQQKISLSPQKFGKPLIHPGQSSQGGQLNRTINPNKSQGLGKYNSMMFYLKPSQASDPQIKPIVN